MVDVKTFLADKNNKWKYITLAVVGVVVILALSIVIIILKSLKYLVIGIVVLAVLGATGFGVYKAWVEKTTKKLT